MQAQEWDWSRTVVDHRDLHASDFSESVRFCETILTPLAIPKLCEHDGAACFTHVNVVAQTPPTKELGLRVPDDMSVVGFDDIPVASFVDPPLTAVRQPMREVGALAAKLLLEPHLRRCDRAGGRPHPSAHDGRRARQRRLAAGRPIAPADRG